VLSRLATARLRERAKTGATQASLPSIESVTAVAITLLKGSGATADKIVDYIRKSIPYYSKINRSSLLSSVVASLESNRHFQPTDKGGKTLWSCTRGASKGRKERRRRASPGVGKRKRGSAKLKARTATQKPVPPITVACEPSSIVCGAVDAMLSDPVAMIPDESADALLLALSGDDSGEDMDIPSDMFTTFDVSGVSALDTLPSPYDLGIDGLGDLSCLLDTPSQAWLPTSYIPPLVGDDGLGIC